MKIKSILNWIVFTIIIYSIYTFFTLQLCIREQFANDITFSNSSDWKSNPLQLKNRFLNSDQENYNKLTRVPFPSNSSVRTANEIKYIKQKQSKLTKPRLDQINKERYNDHIYGKFTDDYTLILQLDHNLNNHIGPISMKLKEEYNRARPYHIDSTLVPSISPPGHPSYPSGHSTQSYYIASCLSSLYPHNKKKYFEIARNIAVNREYAGVHYSSDTSYGEMIGKQLSKMYPIK
jgi:hypothetical protein